MTWKDLFTGWIAKPLVLSQRDREILCEAADILENLYWHRTISARLSSLCFEAEGNIRDILDNER